MAVKHANHVVPQFYLRRFAGDDRMVRETLTDGEASRIIPVKHATVVTDLYTMDSPAGETDGFEDAFSRIESDAARGVHQVLDQNVWPLGDPERQRMSLWLAAQYLRTPRTRGYLEKAMREHRRKIGDWTLDEVRDLVGRDDWTEEQVAANWAETLAYYRAEGPEPRNAHVGWFANLVFEAAKSLFTRPWHLVRFTAPSLLTSDSIVVPLRENLLEPGLHLLSAPMVQIALDRRTILVLLPPVEHLKEAHDIIRPGTSEMAAMANLMIVGFAESSTFEHPGDAIRARLPKVGT